MKCLCAIAFLLAMTGSLLLVLVQRPVTFLSWESKTLAGADVVNRIQFSPGFKFDTWIMQQNHHGPDAQPNQWDRLAIVVNKSTRPYKASFYQFSPGELTMGRDEETLPFAAPCFSCHANGPRAIRPKNSNLIQKIQTSALNIRIKSYGRVDSISGQPAQSKQPFRRAHHAFKKPLQLPSCNVCHGETEIRNQLYYEHLTTAQFLVESKQMPPWPFNISKEDKELIKLLSLH